MSSDSSISDNATSQSSKVMSALLSPQTTKKKLANNALSTGISHLQEGDADKAIQSFKTAIAYNPSLSDAYKYMGSAYTKLGDFESAIKAYQKTVRIDPSSVDARDDLANAYINNEEYDKAEGQYKEEIRMNPRYSNAHYALGQLYLQTEKYREAASEFEKVIGLNPESYHGYYGLGLAYNEMEKYGEAVKQFQKSISLKRDFAYAYCDLGYAYAGLGDTDKAKDQVDILVGLDTDESLSLAAELEISLYTPRIASIDSSSERNTFATSFGPGTKVSFLDPALWTAGASATLSVVIQFNQAMDISSVQNTLNWSISKASGGTAGWYNNGVTVDPQNEISVPPLPICVSYDPETYQATVYFTIRQNATGTGITDPSHWVFKFTGTDISGNAMDTTGDEYDRFAGKAF